MSYEEFLNDLQKRGSKPHSIGHCLGARDAWKWIRKNKWVALKGSRCSHTTYGAVVDIVNQILMEKLLEGHDIHLPHQMGTFRVMGKPLDLKYKNGKLTSNMRTDWKRTLQYWYEDEEARKERHYIKRRQNYVYSLKYLKYTARYKNQKFYMFRVNRSLVRALGKKIENEKLNALIY